VRRINDDGAGRFLVRIRDDLPAQARSEFRIFISGIRHSPLWLGLILRRELILR
jgi:hypothetical protein